MTNLEAPEGSGKKAGEEKKVPEITDDVLRKIFPEFNRKKLSPDEQNFMEMAKQKISSEDQELLKKIEESWLGWEGGTEDKILRNLWHWKNSVRNKQMVRPEQDVLERIDNILLGKILKRAKKINKLPRWLQHIIEIARENREKGLPQFKSDKEVKVLLEKVNKDELPEKMASILENWELHIHEDKDFYKKRISKDPELQDLQYLLSIKVGGLEKKYGNVDPKILELKFKIINKIIQRAKVLNGLKGWVKDMIDKETMENEDKLD